MELGTISVEKTLAYLPGFESWFRNGRHGLQILLGRNQQQRNHKAPHQQTKLLPSLRISASLQKWFHADGRGNASVSAWPAPATLPMNMKRDSTPNRFRKKCETDLTKQTFGDGKLPRFIFRGRGGWRLARSMKIESQYTRQNR